MGARRQVSREWRVYVLELEDAAGPGRLPDTPNLYVGETGRTVLERLGTHLTNKQRGSGKVRLHFRAIRFDLFEGRGPYQTEDDALKAETKLAAELRARGFSIVSKTGEKLRLPSPRKSAKPRKVSHGYDAQRPPGSSRV